MARKIGLAKRLRAAQTKAEARLWQALRAKRLVGRKFRRQHPIDRFVVDFACLEARLIVEVDGETHSTAKELAYDAARTFQLEMLGYRLMRFNNHEIATNLDGVVETIFRQLELAGNR